MKKRSCSCNATWCMATVPFRTFLWHHHKLNVFLDEFRDRKLSNSEFRLVNFKDTFFNFFPISIGNHIVRIHHEPLGITISIENYLQQVPSCKRCVGGWYHVTLVMSCDMFFSSWLWKNNFFWFTFGCMKHGCYHFWQRKHQWCGKLLGFSSPVSSKFRVPQL